MPTRTEAVFSSVVRKQTLEAVVYRACGLCGAPPRYLSHESIRKSWAGCWVEPGDPLEGRLVGTKCPHCAASRGKPQSLGTIWQREWRAGGSIAKFLFFIMKGVKRCLSR